MALKQREENKGKEEGEEAERFALYRKYPMLWLKERFGEDPNSFIWSNHQEYEKHKWDGDRDPLFRMWEALASNNNAAVVSATATGKSYSVSRIIYWFLDCWEDSLVIISAPKEEQVKLITWAELSKAFPKFQRLRPSANMGALTLCIGKEDGNKSWMAKGFTAGVSANEESATRAQGFHRKDMLIIFEETAGMSDATMKAFENTVAGSHNLILAVGNPDSKQDPLCRFAARPSVKSFRVSAFDHPNVVCGRDVIEGAVTQRSIDDRRTDYGENSHFFQSRVRGLPPDQASGALIRLEWLERLWIDPNRPESNDPLFLARILNDLQSKGTNTPDENKNQNKDLPEAQNKFSHQNARDKSLQEFNKSPQEFNKRSFVYANACGIDVANSTHGDHAAIAWSEGALITDVRHFPCPDAGLLADRVIEEMEVRGVQEFNIGIDTVGVGVSTLNRFHMLGKRGVMSLIGGERRECIPVDEMGRPLYRFASLRGQMYWELREDIRLGRILFRLEREIFEKLKEELTIATWETRGGVTVIEPKELIRARLGHSPNMADAVVYCNWSRKQVYESLYIPTPQDLKDFIFT